MKKYEIISIDSHNYLIIVLSVDNIGSYLQSLRDAVSHLEGDVHGLYMDRLLRNGLSDRFFKISVRNHIFDDSSITRCKVSMQISNLSDLFFLRHTRYIQKSIMPSYQKVEYLEHISKLL